MCLRSLALAAVVDAAPVPRLLRGETATGVSQLLCDLDDNVSATVCAFLVPDLRSAISLFSRKCYLETRSRYREYSFLLSWFLFLLQVLKLDDCVFEPTLQLARYTGRQET